MLISEWSSDVCSSDLLTLLLADRLQLLTQLASEDELAAHQRGDVQAARLDHVVHGLAQPAQQLVLMDVRLADLAVEPQHQGLRRPAFHRHVASKLLFLVGERLGNMLAVEVDLAAARRPADRDLAPPRLRGMAETGPPGETP